MEPDIPTPVQTYITYNFKHFIIIYTNLSDIETLTPSMVFIDEAVQVDLWAGGGGLWSSGGGGWGCCAGRGLIVT